MNHRYSTDFDFLSTGDDATPEKVQAMTCFADAGTLQKIKGGPGMVDCVLQPHPKLGARGIAINIMETGAVVLPPARQPKFSAHGIAVAHPIDLCIMKIAAAKSRETLRDYHDLAIAATYWSQHLTESIRILEQHSMPRQVSLKVLVAPPPAVTAQLDAALYKQIATVCA